MKHQKERDVWIQTSMGTKYSMLARKEKGVRMDGMGYKMFLIWSLILWCEMWRE